MTSNTIQAFDLWDEVADYESDETTVTLLDEKGEAIAEFNYPEFTNADFINFKSHK